MSVVKKEEKKEQPKQGGSMTVAQPSQSERFTQEVMKQFGANAPGEVKLTSFQKKLCQNYFIKIDQTLKDAEKKRLAKSEKYRDALEYSWSNVNMQKLAVDVIAFSGVGLDPCQPNQVSVIPYKNTATSKFDIGFIPGYRGLEVKAKKYGLDVPDDVIVEVVYSTDKFKQLKKGLNRNVESYEFEIINNFDRGDIVGGFYYHAYFDKPEKNKLRVFSIADIEKRKPKYASAEFWGGEKDKWEEVDGKNTKVGKEKVEGWYDEMCYKTIFRAAYNAITIDSQKIDDHYAAVISRESELIDAKVAEEIKANANSETIGFEDVTKQIGNGVITPNENLTLSTDLANEVSLALADVKTPAEVEKVKAGYPELQKNEEFNKMIATAISALPKTATSKTGPGF